MEATTTRLRIATMLRWVGAGIFLCACAVAHAEDAPHRVIRAFFPTLDVCYADPVDETPTRERNYGGNSADAPVGDSQGPLRVMVISDLNSSYGSTDYRSGVHDAVQEIIRRRPDVVLSSGDMVAGQRHGLDYRAMWQGFHHAVTLPLEQAGIPLLVTSGNHDGPRSRRYAYQREIYIDEWSKHRPKVTFVDDTHYPEFYSVAMGPTFLIAVDASTVGSLGRQQMRWLETQLKKAKDFPVKIVFGHVPMWAVSRGREREIIGDDALVDLLEAHDVDAFIAGHDHAYYPGVRGRIRYIAAPALGTGPRHLLAPNQKRSPRGFLEFYTGVNGGIYDLESWVVPDFQKVDQRESLPPKVGAGRSPLVRDDLVDMELRSEEFRHGGVLREAVDPQDHDPQKSTKKSARKSKGKAVQESTPSPSRAPATQPARSPRDARALPSDLFED